MTQNYPNPFNPATRITYSILKNGHISLRVFDILGREVAALFEGFRHAGTYAGVFDATGLPSGVYLCWLRTGGIVETTKMVLVR